MDFLLGLLIVANVLAVALESEVRFHDRYGGAFTAFLGS